MEGSDETAPGLIRADERKAWLVQMNSRASPFHLQSEITLKFVGFFFLPSLMSTTERMFDLLWVLTVQSYKTQVGLSAEALSGYSA